MNSKRLRSLAFTLHRYIGLAVGLILAIVGSTGSFLVFNEEIDQFLLNQQIEQIVPQNERLPIAVVLDKVRAAHNEQSGLKVDSIDVVSGQNASYKVWLLSPTQQYYQAYVNPYTGNILDTRKWDNTFSGLALKLHYTLLAGRTGEIIVGIAALLLFILSVTGIALWPGWKKLIIGFKIKWNTHPQRVNFDIHKVAGIITAVFLAMTAFTGFCWNFSDFTYPIIYTATLTPKPVPPTSQPVLGKSALGLNDILQKADAALPGAVTTYIFLPHQPEGVYRIDRKFPQEVEEYGRSRVFLDQYSGEVLQVQDGRSLPLGERVLNSFAPIHYGTFGGLFTRIFYVFVGLAPLILFITGFVMWWYRRKQKEKPAFAETAQRIGY